jgi:hypothetical protein
LPSSLSAATLIILCGSFAMLFHPLSATRIIAYAGNDIYN